MTYKDGDDEDGWFQKGTGLIVTFVGADLAAGAGVALGLAPKKLAYRQK